jgi:hypothetical protein
MNIMAAIDLKPILVAAAIGAVGFFVLQRSLSGLALGAGVGVAVQVGVRLLGVS